VINTYALGNTPVEMVNGSGGLLSRLHDSQPDRPQVPLFPSMFESYYESLLSHKK